MNQLISYHNGMKTVEFKSEADSATFKTEKGFKVVKKNKLKNWDKLPERIEKNDKIR